MEFLRNLMGSVEINRCDQKVSTVGEIGNFEVSSEKVREMG